MATKAELLEVSKVSGKNAERAFWGGVVGALIPIIATLIVPSVFSIERPNYTGWSNEFETGLMASLALIAGLYLTHRSTKQSDDAHAAGAHLNWW